MVAGNDSVNKHNGVFAVLFYPAPVEPALFDDQARFAQGRDRFGYLGSSRFDAARQFPRRQLLSTAKDRDQGMRIWGVGFTHDVSIGTRMPKLEANEPASRYESIATSMLRTYTECMAITRTYVVQVGNDPDSPVLEVTTDDSTKVAALAREQAGSGDRDVVRVRASVAEGAPGPDLRDFDVELSSTMKRESVRAHTSDQAQTLARGKFGDDFKQIAGSRRISDAQKIVEAIANGFDGDPEDVAKKLGMQAAYVADTHSEREGSTPEHFVFADGSVADLSGKHDYPDFDEMMSSMGEAAHEQLTADFHAGDSGFRDPGSDYAQAHEDRRQLRSLDGARPSLSDDAAPAADVSDDATDLSL